MKKPFILVSEVAEPSLALTIGQGLPDKINGQPVQYFWKEMIRVGHYVHPQTGQDIDVTPQRLDMWLSNFTRMATAGEKVYVPVDHSKKAEDNRGYVLAMRRKGDVLEGMHQLIGDDAIKLAARSEISLWIEPDYQDGRGNKYGESILHSSLVSDPVVPGQTGFMPIAASRGQADGALVFTAASRSQAMLTPEQLKDIRDLLGAADVTEDKAIERLIAGAKTFKADLATKATALSTAATQLQDAQQKLTVSEGKVIQLSASAPRQPDPEAIEALAEADEAGLSTCVERGAITKDVADKLKPVLLGTSAKRNVMALSKSMTGTDLRMTRAIIDILKDNKPVPMGQITGAQVLGRDTPGGDAATQQANADYIKSRAQTVSPVAIK